MELFPAIALWTAVAALGATHLALGVARVSLDTLSHVALRRMQSESPRHYDWFGTLSDAASPHRLALSVARQLFPLGAFLLAAHAFEGATNWTERLQSGGWTVLAILVLDILLGRSLALRDPRRALRSTSALVRLVQRLLWPIVMPLSKLHQMMAAAAPSGDEMSEEEQEDEVDALIEVGELSGILERDEGAMVRGIVDLDETLVRELIIPVGEMKTLPDSATVAEARQAFMDEGHSRLPVYRETIDEIIGVLHARDLFRAWKEGADTHSITEFLRTAAFVQEDKSAAWVLAEMRTKTQIAIVVDRLGSVSGLVTLEDLLEEIVGEIRDEHEEMEQNPVIQLGNGVFRIKAMAHVDTLENLFGLEFEDRDFDTVGGWVVSNIGRVPAVGERLFLEGLIVEINKADKRRVDVVSITRDLTVDAESTA